MISTGLIAAFCEFPRLIEASKVFLIAQTMQFATKKMFTRYTQSTNID